MRGAFVMARLFGQPPNPPPPNIPAVERDVQGATTIRELLGKHRADASCASCHAKIEGLERATVDSGIRTLTAWIDPAKTNRTALEHELKKARVELAAPGSEKP